MKTQPIKLSSISLNTSSSIYETSSTAIGTGTNTTATIGYCSSEPLYVAAGSFSDLNLFFNIFQKKKLMNYLIKCFHVKLTMI